MAGTLHLSRRAQSERVSDHVRLQSGRQGLPSLRLSAPQAPASGAQPLCVVAGASWLRRLGDRRKRGGSRQGKAGELERTCRPAWTQGPGDCPPGAGRVGVVEQTGGGTGGGLRPPSPSRGTRAPLLPTCQGGCRGAGSLVPVGGR